MSDESHDWIVFQRIRFANPIDGNGKPLPGPQKAEAWRFYPASPPGENGARTSVSDEWGGFGLYATRSDAEEVFQNPDKHLPFLGDAVETYHALVLPFAHRGEVNWRGDVRSNATIAVSASDPGGPLVVFTSAGYDNPGPDDVPRIGKFLKEVDNVQAYYATLPGNLRRAVYSGVPVDGHDGMTVSLWKDDKAMLAAAYKPGHHRTQMDYHRDVGHFDRSSFSRARIISSKGTWDGTDPVLEMS
ncbi:hypothetical protein [Marimonas lutisalis]|uniref:hypothetical protein n=1 Tax=Marimonas lutisalis TaxID=2545756 RepID=UPI0010F88592|nr:hypothetical protein [Marimonas lutisalis]